MKKKDTKRKKETGRGNTKSKGKTKTERRIEEINKKIIYNDNNYCFEAQIVTYFQCCQLSLFQFRI